MPAAPPGRDDDRGARLQRGAHSGEHRGRPAAAAALLAAPGAARPLQLLLQDDPAMLGFSTRHLRHKRRRIISTAVHAGVGGLEGATQQQQQQQQQQLGAPAGHRAPLSHDQAASIRINKSLTSNSNSPKVRARACVGVWMGGWVYVFVCMHVRMYIHTYIHILRPN
jgi:hypothetical protein